MWIVCVGDAPVVVNPTLSVGDGQRRERSHPNTSSLVRGSVVIENAGIFGMYIGIPLCDHNRASPKLDITVRPLCPTLSVSDAEHGVTHYCSLSETAEWYAKSETLHTSNLFTAPAAQ